MQACVRLPALLLASEYEEGSSPVPSQLQFTAAAAAAKSLQLCLTLCDPVDGSPPGSSVHGILQATVLEWAAISFSQFTARQALLSVFVWMTI